MPRLVVVAEDDPHVGHHFTDSRRRYSLPRFSRAKGALHQGLNSDHCEAVGESAKKSPLAAIRSLGLWNVARGASTALLQRESSRPTCADVRGVYGAARSLHTGIAESSALLRAVQPTHSFGVSHGLAHGLSVLG